RDSVVARRGKRHGGPSRLPRHGGRRRGRFEDSGRAAAGGAAEDVIGQGGDFQEDINRGDERNQEDGKPTGQLKRGDVAGALEGEHSNNKVADDVDDRGGDDFIEGVLEETAQPAPEKPLKFRHDEERNKDGADQHTDRGSNEPISDDDDGYCLSGGEQDDDDDVDGHAQEVSDAGRVDACFEISDAVHDRLQFGLIDLV